MLSAAPALAYVQTNLVSNIEGMALITDPELVNPWDVNFPQQPWIKSSRLRRRPRFGRGHVVPDQPRRQHRSCESSSPVTIPTVGSSEPSGPTGVVQNTHPEEFLIPGPDGTHVPATYIFDTLQGTIGGYSVDANGDHRNLGRDHGQ